MSPPPLPWYAGYIPTTLMQKEALYTEEHYRGGRAVGNIEIVGDRETSMKLL